LRPGAEDQGIRREVEGEYSGGFGISFLGIRCLEEIHSGEAIVGQESIIALAWRQTVVACEKATGDSWTTR
jgi:hypothetical protein